eukprot:EG_transcript_30806
MSFKWFPFAAAHRPGLFYVLILRDCATATDTWIRFFLNFQFLAFNSIFKESMGGECMGLPSASSPKAHLPRPVVGPHRGIGHHAMCVWHRCTVAGEGRLH